MEKTYYFAVCTKHNLKNENWDALKEEYARRKHYCGDLLFFCQSFEKDSCWYGNKAIYTFLNESKENTIFTLSEGVIEEFRTEGIGSDYKLVIEITNNKGENLPLAFKRINPYSQNHLIPHEAPNDDKKVMLEHLYQWDGYDEGAFKEVVKLIQSLEKGSSYKDYCEYLEQRFRYSQMIRNTYQYKEKVEKCKQISSSLYTQVALLKESIDSINSETEKDTTLAPLLEKIKQCKGFVNECESTLTELNKTL